MAKMIQSNKGISLKKVNQILSSDSISQCIFLDITVPYKLREKNGFVLNKLKKC